MKNAARITANDVQAMLMTRHNDDIYVQEFCCGQDTSIRMDGCAIKASWQNRDIYGYEIKVRRQDFLNDTKFHRYMDYCNLMYMVCPWGLIAPEEVPEKCGLLYMSKTGNRLMTKKKAVFHEISDIHEKEVLRRMLFRTTNKNGYEQWRSDYLKYKSESNEYGNKISRKISTEVSKKVREVDAENFRLVKEISKYENIKSFLSEMGIKDTHIWSYREQLKSIFDDGTNRAKRLLNDIESLISHKEYIEDIINKSKVK